MSDSRRKQAGVNASDAEHAPDLEPALHDLRRAEQAHAPGAGLSEIAELIDSHCHIHDTDDPQGAWQRAKEQGVTGIICIGTDVSKSKSALKVASQIGSKAWATVGLHPHDASLDGAQGVEGIEALIKENLDGGALVGVGECGLDYFYEHSPRRRQRESFEAQIELAARFDLTLVIHARDAWPDVWSILGSADLPRRVVFHCFTGGVNEARTCLDFGAWLSFSGIATFPSAVEVREAVVFCPADKLLVETDTPFLAPVPHRGKPNEPALVRVVAEKIASERGQSLAEVAALTYANTVAAFNLPSVLQ